MLLYQILAKLFEKLRIPLDDSLLFLTTLPLNLLILFLEPVEDVLEFITF